MTTKYTRKILEQTFEGLLRTHAGLRGGYKADSTRKIRQFRARLAKLSRCLPSILPEDDGRLVWPEDAGHPANERRTLGAHQ